MRAVVAVTVMHVGEGARVTAVLVWGEVWLR